MEGQQQALVNELRRAISQTPDSVEQKALYEKLGLLEAELDKLARREREFHDADRRLQQTDRTILRWRMVVGLLALALIGLCGWLLAGIWHAL